MAVRHLSFIVAPLVAVAGLVATPAARADAAADAAIRATLEQWRQDFNARRSERICDLFASDLRADFPGVPELTHTLVCTRLRRALAEPDGTTTLGLRVKEVIVSGAMAVARLTWTTTERSANGQLETQDEQGLDIFARQPDGRWQIVRYIAFPDR